MTNALNYISVPKNLEVVYTHGGIFHADDVFSTALLRIWSDSSDFTVKRVFKLPEEENIFAYDIGCGKFDHHQKGGNGVRENGIPYAAFGLLWKELGSSILGSKEEADRFDQEFVQVIDNSDCTGEINILSMMFSSLNPNWDENIPTDELFNQAVDIALSLLDAKITSIKSKLKANLIVKGQLENFPEDIDYLVLDKFVPWQDVLIPSRMKFVIFPAIRGGFNLQVVPKELGNPAAKQDLPVEWLENKPKGCTFVHNGLFLASFETEDDAINAVESII